MPQQRIDQSDENLDAVESSDTETESEQIGGDTEIEQTNKKWKNELRKLRGFLTTEKKRIRFLAELSDAAHPPKLEEDSQSLLRKAKELPTNEELSSTEFCVAATPLLAAIPQRIAELESMFNTLRHDTEALYHESGALKQAIDDFEKSSFIHKLLHRREQETRRAERSEKGRLFVAKGIQEQDVSEKKSRLEKARESLAQSYSDHVSKELQTSISNAQEKFCELTKNLIIDPAILSQIRTAEAESILRKNHTKDGLLLPEYNDLRALLDPYINSGTIPDYEEKREMLKSLEAFFHDHRDPHLTHSNLNSFIQEGTTEDIFVAVVCEFLGKELAEFTEAVRNTATAVQNKTVREQARPKPRTWEGARHAFETGPGHYLLAGEMESADVLKKPFVPGWSVIRSAPAMTGIFGSQTAIMNERIEKEYIVHAPADSQGYAIDPLEYFPSEQTVRALILLATADDGHYRRQHAMFTLVEISRRDDWPELLESTIRRYAELEPARSVLLEFPNRTFHSLIDVYPAMRTLAPVTADLAHSAYALESQPAWKRVAFEHFDTVEQLTMLTGDDRFPPGQIEKVRTSLQSLADWCETNHRQYFGETFYNKSRNALETVIGGTLESVTDSPELRRIPLLVDRIQNEADTSLLNYYVANELCDLFSSENVTDDEFAVALDAIHACPVLLDTAFRHVFFVKGKNRNAFLTDTAPACVQRIAEAFESDPIARDFYLEVVKDGGFSFEDALSIPKKFPSLMSEGSINVLNAGGGIFFTGEKGLQFHARICEAYPANKLLGIILKAVKDGDIDEAYALSIPKKFPNLLQENTYDIVTKFGGAFFKKEHGVERLSNILTAYDGFSPLIITAVLDAMVHGSLDEARALTLPADAPEICSKNNSYLLQSYPALFTALPDNGDLASFLRYSRGEIACLSPDQERASAKVFGTYDHRFSCKIAGLRLRSIFEVAQDRPSGYVEELFDANSRAHWKDFLEAFIAISMEVSELISSGALTRAASEPIKKLFESQDVKNYCLGKMQELWRAGLAGGNYRELPYSLSEISGIVLRSEGAGPLKHIESLASFVHALRNTFNAREALTPRTCERIFEKIGSAEERFDRARWSDGDRTVFYDLSTDILNAQPRLYLKCLAIMERCDPKELKIFAEELFPLYHAYLSIIDQKVNAVQPRDRTRSSEEMVLFEARLRTFAKKASSKTTDIHALLAEEKQAVHALIQEQFKKRFGIRALPETYSEEAMRSIGNIVRYRANTLDRNKNTDAVFALFLAQMINGQWEAFRRGDATLDAKDIFDADRAAHIQTLLQQRVEAPAIAPEILGIPPESMEHFQKILQADTDLYHVSNVQTVDVKLGALMRGLSDLLDEDIFADPVQKRLLSLLKRFGAANVNTALSALFLERSGKRTSKDGAQSAGESDIKNEIEHMLSEHDRPVDTATIKALQEQFRPLALIGNIVEYTRELKTDDRIAKLQALLAPNESVVEIFTRLGEEFTPTSGALALSQDLDYLQNLIAKRGDDVSPAERVTLSEYLGAITTALADLEKIYGDVSERFSKLERSTHVQANEHLRAQTSELQKIINQSSDLQEIRTLMTGNLNEIIENIRACLSCVTKGANNDTNLSFGDPNKFLVMSKSKYQKERGSMADEIVYLFPLAHPDHGRELSFVLDQIYGNKSSDMLVGHVLTVFKKYGQIKKAFPDAHLSIFVTSAALRSAGLSSETLIARLRGEGLKKARVEQLQGAEITVPPSAFSSHYIEFAQSGARITGPQSVDGVRISI